MKTFYLLLKQGLRRIEIMGPDDVKKAKKIKPRKSKKGKTS